MPHRLILEAVRSDPRFPGLLARLPSRRASLAVGGMPPPAAAAVVAALHEAAPERLFVAVAPSPGAAAALEADLEALLGEDRPRLYPQREALPYEAEEPHLEVGGLRVEALEAVFGGRTRLLVTTLRALQERAPIPRGLAGLRLTLEVGRTVRLPELVAALEERGFERVPLVEEVGQFAVRGGIVDLHSFGAPDPVRIEFWEDEIVSIRPFDILDQRSKGEWKVVHVLPVDFRARGGDGGGEEPRSLLELLPEETVLCSLGLPDPRREAERTWDEVLRLHQAERVRGRTPPPPGELFLDPDGLQRLLDAFAALRFREHPSGAVVFRVRPPEPVERDMERLGAVLRAGSARGERTLVLCDNPGQLERLEELLGGADSLPPGVQLAVGSLSGGFRLPDARPPLRILTDHEIFRRARRLRRARATRGAVALESLAQLRPGDLVVHLEHGVGEFRGLERIRVGGQEVEALAIRYEGGDVLRVPVYRLDLVERWVGESDEAEPPPLDRIGGRRWKRLRRRAEAALETLAAELLELYARRERATGFAFSPDTRWQKEMESAFLYEDTPDQRRAAVEVKRDMESPRPMDRLVCGDVGYGKTEVAVRAAFKAVQDGKQIAVLAPTTILVEQHLRTFRERLADYPVTIEGLSRFRTPREQREILRRLEEGSLDIVVGTHRLLSDDIRFRDLGLVVVDEEQRFGVRQKERLKALRASVDVLTLTATPIPRTLYLSLSRLRDISLIRTPPRDRTPIITHVLPWSDEILRDAIQRELDRGGQVFFLHNRVETIGQAAARVRALAPDARIAIAHGQLPSRELDRVMASFLAGKVDVLVCSSIIENGLDVPNANTLIVNRAERFGLAQLYQIRGRVGRSHRRAYCYLIVPDGLPEEAERRLRVLEHYTELGSGYSVALRDLEIRGAGNLLGAEQSGFAHRMGIDTYLRLLERTIRRLQAGEAREEFPDPEVSLAGGAYLPDAYISDPGQKLHLYRRLSRLEGPEEVESLRGELRDRFGPPPPEVERLLDGATLRLLGRRLGIESFAVGEEEARVNFRGDAAPRLTPLQGALGHRQVDVEVRRLDPLSLVLRRRGRGRLSRILAEGLALLAREAARAA